jgi:hypothetical protein
MDHRRGFGGLIGIWISSLVAETDLESLHYASYWGGNSGRKHRGAFKLISMYQKPQLLALLLTIQLAFLLLHRATHFSCKNVNSFTNLLFFLVI